VETAAAILNPHIPEVRHKPILLMAQALAEALDSFNRDLDLFPLNGNPADRSKILRLRNWIRDSFGEYLKLPGFAPVGIHYDRSLAYISLLSLEEEASQHLTSPLSDQVLAKVRSLQELPSDDPRLSRDLRVLGSQVGSFSRDTYLALLDFALKNGLVTRRLDSVNNPLLNGFRRRYRRLHPEGFPPIEIHRIEKFYELELMVNHLRDKWGAYSAFLRGYDREFNQLDKRPQDGLQRYQILKRLEAFLFIKNEMDPSGDTDGDSD
jgi:hypothetical protein